MYKQGNIVLVPIPFSDLSNQKQRPVLIISSNRYNQVSHNIIVVAITSRIRNLDYAVKIQTEDLVEGDLRFTSEIRTDKIYDMRFVKAHDFSRWDEAKQKKH